MDHFSDEWFRSEWRKLRFYYEVDHAAKQWTITGEVGGLEAFVAAVRLYASDPGNDWISCHCNLSPYDESLLAREFFSPSSPYDLCLHLIGAGFDPSSLDSALTG